MFGILNIGNMTMVLFLCAMMFVLPAIIYAMVKLIYNDKYNTVGSTKMYGNLDSLEFSEPVQMESFGKALEDTDPPEKTHIKVKRSPEFIPDSDVPYVYHDKSTERLGEAWNLVHLKKKMGDEKCSVAVTKDSVLNFFHSKDLAQKNITWKTLIQNCRNWSKKGKETNPKKFTRYQRENYYNAQNSLPAYLHNELNTVLKLKPQVQKYLDSEKSRYALEDLVYWFGSNDYYTPLHFDHEDGLLHCLHGTKHVRLVDPKYTSLIKASQVFMYSDYASISDCPENVPVHYVKLRPGDVLYIPQGWWHQVQSVGEEFVVGDNDTNVTVYVYHLAITYWLRPKEDEEYSYDKQLKRIGKVQNRQFKKNIKISELSDNDVERLKKTGIWNTYQGKDAVIENPLFTDKYD